MTELLEDRAFVLLSRYGLGLSCIDAIFMIVSAAIDQGQIRRFWLLVLIGHACNRFQLYVENEEEQLLTYAKPKTAKEPWCYLAQDLQAARSGLSVSQENFYSNF